MLPWKIPMCVSAFLHEIYQDSFLILFKLKTKCNVKFNDIFVWFRLKMYLQLLKKAGKIFNFFHWHLSKTKWNTRRFYENDYHFTRYEVFWNVTKAQFAQHLLIVDSKGFTALKRAQKENATQTSVFALSFACRGIVIALLIWSFNNYSLLCKSQDFVSLVFVHFLKTIQHPNEIETSFYFVIKLKWKWRTVLYDKHSFKSQSIS